MKKVIIHLANKKQLVIENYTFVNNYYFNELNNNNPYIMIRNYIIPKSSINYIEFLKEESEEK